MTRFPLIPTLLLALATPAFAADAPARTEGDILKSVKLPDGYEATVFAMPPTVGYPTAVSVSADGVLFVAVDENGSLDAKPGRGRVLRCIDSDGDGKADKTTVFAEMDSPRGVIWDGPSGAGPGTIYVMHPPNLTSYTDTDGDGKSDNQEEIITGLGFDLKFRGADHTTNGCRLGIDGFIYVAVGDYGYVEAKGKDGTVIKNRGGGIVRVRPDGTGLEIVSRGQRNIYDVAVSPTLDLFTRDNTNDGGGWDVRLSFVPPGAHMGYPTLFKNFAEDMLQPLAVLGGGSPCGALWLDEPGLPQGLFTVEWGRNAIIRHTLKPKGAGWETDGPKHGEEEWIKITRPTDMDVDASGALFITSWEGATFNYNGPNAGYVLRVVKKDAPNVAVPNLAKAGLEQVLKALASPSAVLRMAAQRVLIQKEFLPGVLGEHGNMSGGNATLGGPLADGLMKIIGNDALPLSARVAALETFSLRYCRGGQSVVNLHTFATVPAMREFVIRQMGEESWRYTIPEMPVETVLGEALADQNPRVRAAAITALRRVGKANAAQAILPLVADADPIITHLAIRALSELKASQVCLAALDAADDKVKPGALQTLYGIHEPAVVDGLIARLQPPGGARDPRALSGDSPERTGKSSQANTVSSAGSPKTALGSSAPPSQSAGAPYLKPDGSFDLRHGLLNALCRLANADAPYTDPKEWWGTRPDTSGPVYKPAAWAETNKIVAALKRELDSAQGEDARWLVQTMYKSKVNFPGLVDLMLAKAGTDTAAKLTAVEGLFAADNALPPEGLAALTAVATDEKHAPDFRAKALRLLARASERGAALDAAIAAFAPFAGAIPGHASIAGAFEDFTRDGKQTKNLGALEKIAAANDAAKRTLAQTILVNLATSALVKGKDKEAAEKAVAKAWEKPETAASLLGVIARTKSKTYADQVQAHLKDPNNAVAESALFAYQALGLKDTGAPAAQIGTMKYEAVFAAVQKGGDAVQGRDIYLRAGCIACHTLSADEPAKGPILSAAAKIYDRAALTESLLKPNAKLAQGFETAIFKTKKAGEIQGFVTREGGDSVDVRNIAGQTVTIEKGDITQRGKSEQSMMPEGLLNTFTPADVANLLAFLESLKGK